MKMNLAVGLKDLAGNQIMDGNNAPILLSKQLANIIISEEAKDNPAQKYELATRLFNANGAMEITESEKEIIKGVCNSGRLTVLFAAQILNIVNNAN